MKDNGTHRALLVLRQFFPERALGLLDYLKKRNKVEKALPAWRETQLEKFIRQLSLNSDEMKEAYLAQRVMRLAWAVRNLLEISVWVTYCDQSRGNAELFHEDAARDAIGWANVIQSEYTKSGQGPHKRLDESIKGVADRFLAGVVDDDFTRVVNAADSIGLRSKFVAKNKLLSKYAHPTAWSIASVLPRAVEADGDVRGMFLIDGVELASGTLTRIRETIIAKLPFREPDSPQ